MTEKDFQEWRKTWHPGDTIPSHILEWYNKNVVDPFIEYAQQVDNSITKIVNENNRNNRIKKI